MKENKFGKTENTAERNVRREVAGRENEHALAEKGARLGQERNPRLATEAELEEALERSDNSSRASAVLEDIGLFGACTDRLLRHMSDMLFFLSVGVGPQGGHKFEECFELSDRKNLKGLGPISEIRPSLDSCFAIGEEEIGLMRMHTCARAIDTTGAAPEGYTKAEVKMARWWLFMCKHLEPLLVAAKGFREAAVAGIADVLARSQGAR